MTIAPTIASSWTGTDTGGSAIRLFPRIFWMAWNFSSIIWQRDPIDPASGNPGGWSLELFLLQTCCSSTRPFASVSPFSPWPWCPQAVPLDPSLPLSPLTPNSYGHRRAVRRGNLWMPAMGLQPSGEDKIRRLSCLLPHPPSHRIAKLPYELK